MKKSILISLLCFMVVFLFGCSQDKTIDTKEVKTNTILLKNEGTVQAATVEIFDKDYYNSTELETFITEKINEYNGANTADSIALGSLEVKDGSAILLLNYKTLNDYNLFNETEVVFTSVEAAKSGSITLPEVFVSASDGAYVAPEVALKNNKYKFIVIKDNTEVIVDGKIKYFTNGKLLSKSRFQASGESESVLIYKP